MALRKFQVSLPVVDLLPRNRFVNTFHMDHNGIVAEDLNQMCSDIADMYQTRYGKVAEVDVKVYDVGLPPNYPLEHFVKTPGTAWSCNVPQELALCLSYSGDNRGNKNERGRIYLAPQLANPAHTIGARPTQTTLDWALAFYTTSNSSFPDLGGSDWTFGIWSKTRSKFTGAQQAWVNDDWDIQRRRGLREANRVSATREG